jgi:hypothetical protein
MDTLKATYRKDVEPAVMLTEMDDKPAHNEFLSTVHHKKPYPKSQRFYKTTPTRISTMTAFDLDACTKSAKQREKDEQPINSLKDWFAAYGTPEAAKRGGGGAMLR